MKKYTKNPTVSFKIQVFGTELDSWWRLKSSLLRRSLKIVSPCWAFCIVLFSIGVINRWGDAVHLLKGSKWNFENSFHRTLRGQIRKSLIFSEFFLTSCRFWKIHCCQTQKNSHFLSVGHWRVMTGSSDGRNSIPSRIFLTSLCRPIPSRNVEPNKVPLTPAYSTCFQTLGGLWVS